MTTTPIFVRFTTIVFCACLHVRAEVAVLSVQPESAASRAGIRAGDLLLAWPGGSFTNPFDVQFAATQSEASPATLVSGSREGQPTAWQIPRGDWGIETSPVLEGTSLTEYHAGVVSQKNREFAEAALHLQNAAAATSGADALWLEAGAASSFLLAGRQADGDRLFAASLVKASSDSVQALELERSWGDALFERSEWDSAKGHYEKALAAAIALKASLVRALVLYDIGRVAVERRRPKEAMAPLKESLALRESADSRGAPVVDSLIALGRAAYSAAELETAEQYFQRALELAQAENPESRSVAAVLHNLGLVALGKYNLTAADSYLTRSLAISQKLNPGGTEWANTAESLGNVNRRRGDLTAAETLYEQALDIRRKLVPGTLALASSLNNLGNLHRVRGDLVRAEEEFRESLAIAEKLAPDSREVAGALENLGTVAQTRYDLDVATSYYQRALKLWDQVAPDSVYWAGTLVNLALVAQDQGNLDQSERYYRQALSRPRWQSAAPLALAEANRGLAQLYVRRGQLDRAAAEYNTSMTALERDLPGSPSVADVQFQLGAIAERKGDWAEAEQYYTQSFTIRNQLLPHTAELAESLNALGKVARHDNDSARAEQFFKQAIDCLEAQNRQLGGSDFVRAGFRAYYLPFYRDLIEQLVARNQPTQALEVLERSRARALLELLATRDIEFAGVPGDLKRDMQANSAAYDRVQAQMSDLSPSRDRAVIAQLQAQLIELNAARARLIERIREASPRFAALRFPAPLDLSGIQRALDPSAALLSYSVGTDRTLLFVVKPVGQTPPVSVLSIPVSEAALRASVKHFREAIQDPTTASQTLVARQATDLYRSLVEPAVPLIEHADRLLILPDGPLHTLPFAALRTRNHGYLAAWKPLGFAISGTIYAQLVHDRPPLDDRRAAHIAVFADPAYSARENALRIGATRLLDLGPLPFSRLEADRVAALYPHETRLYLGPQATEERAKSLEPDVKILLFAVHGLLDERFPLNSGLAFSTPPASLASNDNGLLQAWELYSEVHWSADLAVLSACETGLGPELGGEGLMSLTRAIQYAGVRSVVSTLWSIDDRRTAQLTASFFRHLRAGKPKDEALRSAQLEILRSPASASPFYWAAFVLNGDWK